MCDKEKKCEKCVQKKINLIIKNTTTKYLYKKIKNNKKNIRIMVPSFEFTMKENLLSELLYNFETNFLCLFVKNQPNTLFLQQDLIIPDSEEVSVNQGKKFTADNLIIYINKKKLNTQYGFFKKYQFVNNTSLSVIFENVCATVFKSSDNTVTPYVPFASIITTRSFIYYPNSYLFLMICPEPFAIYILIYYVSDFDYPNLLSLGDKLTLPTGWVYTYYQTQDYIGINNMEYCDVTTDDLDNVYQLVDQKYNKELYDNYLR
jgi:hypothetical protein